MRSFCCSTCIKVSISVYVFGKQTTLRFEFKYFHFHSPVLSEIYNYVVVFVMFHVVFFGHVHIAELVLKNPD